MMNKTKIILLPGLDGTGRFFQPFIKECPADFQPVVVKYPQDLISSYNDLHETICSTFPVNGKFLLLGESFSGPVALRTASKFPDRVIGVIMVATYISPPMSGWIRFLPTNLFTRLPGFSIVVKNRLLNTRNNPELLSLIIKELKSNDPKVIGSRIKMILTTDEKRTLKNVNVPVLYLKAMHDRLIPGRCFDIIKKIKPDVRVKEFDSPHLILQTEPSKSWQVITDFRNEVYGDINS